jgi:hypothetical protein
MKRRAIRFQLINSLVHRKGRGTRVAYECPAEGAS